MLEGSRSMKLVFQVNPKIYPVWQHNSCKHDKYEIDFFILANTSEVHNFSYHIDVYQGKSINNISISLVFGAY